MLLISTQILKILRASVQAKTEPIVKSYYTAMNVNDSNYLV